jgi:hypothetical protein
MKTKKRWAIHHILYFTRVIMGNCCRNYREKKTEEKGKKGRIQKLSIIVVVLVNREEEDGGGFLFLSVVPHSISFIHYFTSTSVSY